MAWGDETHLPGMPFNQTFTFPHRLTLRTTADGVRLFAEPVKEIEKLHKRRHVIKDKHLAAAQIPVSSELLDIRATFEIGTAKACGLDVGGNRIVYEPLDLIFGPFNRNYPFTLQQFIKTYIFQVAFIIKPIKINMK